jgi:excisionase family DNA binding protein
MATKQRKKQMSKESVIKSLYSLQQIVDKTGIGYDMLLSSVKSGKLKAFQPGGRKYLVHKKDLNAYLSELSQSPVQQNVLPEPKKDQTIELGNQAALLMIQANALIAKAQQLLKEIA